MDLYFTKMEGLGNDFVLIDHRKKQEFSAQYYGELSKKLCNRRFGIGADGLLIVLDSETCDIRFRIFNSDGSEAQMCGNGIRCLSRYAYESGITEKIDLSIETLAGTIYSRLNLDEKNRIVSITVDMGEPCITAEKIPFITKKPDDIIQELETEHGPVFFTAVSMGNPHAVIFVNDVFQTTVYKTGPDVENHKAFPQKTNVEFVQVLSEKEIRMKVWERGAGVTPACGTGACAAVVAAVLNKKTGREVKVYLDGGELEILWDKESNRVLKTGPANTVFRGVIKTDS